MFKNTSSQKIQLFAFDYSTGAPKTGDAANLTAYIEIDGGATTALGDTSATEKSATNAPGVYEWDLSQAETNGNDLVFTAKSSTGNVALVARFVTTVQNRFQATARAGAGNTNTHVLLQASTTNLQVGDGDILLAVAGTSTGSSGIVKTRTGMGGATPECDIVSGLSGGGVFDGTTVYDVIKVGAIVPAPVTDVWSGTANPTRTLTSSLNITSGAQVLTVSGTGAADTDVKYVAGVAVQQSGSGTQNMGGP